MRVCPTQKGQWGFQVGSGGHDLGVRVTPRDSPRHAWTHASASAHTLQGARGSQRADVKTRELGPLPR